MTQTAQAALGVLMLDLQGPTLSSDERELLQNPHVGGLILFARNYVDRAQLKDLVSSIRACRPDILLAVDQEGGRVQRLRKGFTALPPMFCFQQWWNEDPAEAVHLAENCGWLMAAEVLACDIDFSFAPVLDLHTSISEVIGNRAFASAPELIVELASAFMRGMHTAGMATTGKHFPGHGSVTADSHIAIPVDGRTLEDIRASDLHPFAACTSLLDAVMPAHVIYSAVDKSCAGFSRFWLQEILRGELGFNGVIFSDDLSMAGAAAAGDLSQRIDAALDAGCDMLLVCNDRPAALKALEHLQKRQVSLNTRLPSMRKRQNWTQTQLQESNKWQTVSTTLRARKCSA